jgi:5'-methylthioadenosine phosphorylase
VLGVIGGSGLYEMDELEDVERVSLDTPFGEPSGAFTVGHLPRDGAEPIRAVFLPRHGVGHVLTPGEINYRANVHGFKQLGVTHLLSISAVGSLREDIAPGHVVLPDQFIDRTRGRESTFFGGGAVAHVQFGHPTTDAFRERVGTAATTEGATVHDRGTLVVMEGPAFSTRAESELYRSWGAQVIGMTALPEAKLAREAEMAYAVLALSTDYDCWHEAEEEVSVDAVLAIVKQNVELARAVVRRLARTLPASTEELPFPRALEGAVATSPTAIPAVTRERLNLIIGHYLEKA